MAQRSNRRTRITSASVDPDDINFWTSKRLQDELKSLGVNTSAGLSKNVLKSLYQSNKDRNSQTTGNTTLGRNRSRSPVNTDNVNQSVALNTTAAMTPASSGSETTAVRMTPMTSTPPITTHHCACANTLATNHNNNALPFTGPQIPMIGNTLLQHNIAPQLHQQPSFNSTNNTNFNPASYPDGLPADFFKDEDNVNTDIREEIISGKVVNLTKLLIPCYETQKEKKEKDDPRINRDLDAVEFQKAFKIYLPVRVP